MRIFIIIIFHLSKLWKVKLSLLCDVIFLVGLEGKFDIDHSQEWKGNDPFTPKSDQLQISPAASPETLHHTVWRTWLFILYILGESTFEVMSGKVKPHTPFALCHNTIGGGFFNSVLHSFSQDFGLCLYFILVLGCLHGNGVVYERLCWFMMAFYQQRRIQ